MDISTNQLKTLTLEGITPTKVSGVDVPKKQDTVEASDAIQKSIQVGQQTNKENLQAAVSQINDHVQSLQRSLQFTVDEESGKDVVTVLDKETDEIIRQYPSDEVLAIARHIAEHKEDVITMFNSHV